MSGVESVRQEFRRLYGREPMILRSPARVNLIGEHTDYNDGFVLPASVDRVMLIALARRNDRQILLHAADLHKSFVTTVDDLRRSGERWPDYLLGVVDQLRRAGSSVGGFECLFGGDIPIGAGMSSSAAIEAGLAFGLNDLFQLGIDKLSLVRLAQRSENEFVGVRCGIMDQFINIFGREGHVLVLDCRSLAYEHIPFAHRDIRIVLCDTLVKHDLATSEYNIRRRQCEEGVEALRKHDPGIRALRDVAAPFLEAHRAELDPIVYRRCAYVINENARVLAAADDLRRDNLAGFGQRMYASHSGLRDEYEVSSPELDLLVDAAAGVPGVIGARMMGGGFGGCTINLVEEAGVGEFSTTVRKVFKDRLGRDLPIYVCSLQAGTEWVTPTETRSSTTP